MTRTLCLRTMPHVFVAAVCVTTSTAPVYAGICDTAWAGDKIAAAVPGRIGHTRIPLRDEQQVIHEITVEQLTAFSEAKERISRLAQLSPTFIVCGGAEPNAFATSTSSGEVVGVTIGMLKLVNGGADMAAAVIGHEVAHHTKQHRQNAAAHELFVGLTGVILGAVVDAKAQRRTGVSSGLGAALGGVGAPSFLASSIAIKNARPMRSASLT